MEFDFDLLHLILAALVIIVAVLWINARAKLKAAPPSEPAAIAEPPAAASEPVRESGKLQSANPDSALQLLSLLQHDGRFLDFLQEDLSSFSDSEIGAVARVVHEGSRKTLSSYFEITPLRSEDEESQITIAEGFDPAEVRFAGNLVGQAPFRGTLIHRGWAARNVSLPRLAEGHDTAILAPAEVELS